MCLSRLTLVIGVLKVFVFFEGKEGGADDVISSIVGLTRLQSPSPNLRRGKL